MRTMKRDLVLEKKRNLFGAQAPPIPILIVPLQQDINISAIVSKFVTADEEAIVTSSPCGHTHIRYVEIKNNIC